jgi:hypothetical protein
MLKQAQKVQSVNRKGMVENYHKGVAVAERRGLAGREQDSRGRQKVVIQHKVP